MRVRVEQGDVTAVAADAVVVNLFEGVKVPGGATGAMDRALGGLISTLIASGDIRGKSGELTLLHAPGRPAPRVLVAGLGRQADFNLNAIRNLSANVTRHLRRPGIKRIATIVHGAGIGGLPPAECAQALVEGAILGDYRFLRHKKADEDRAEIDELVVLEQDTAVVPDLEAAAARGVVFGQATNAARDLANEPANHLTPTGMAEAAAALAAAHGLELEVLDEDAARTAGMGAFLSVAGGSHQPAKFIALGYRGRGGDGYDLALVGKGITFDTGGISIKQAANMDAMKADMTGAASVLQAVAAVARLGAKVDVLAVAPCTENMPGGSATKPGDVVKAMNGLTIEVLNTDAEGRLVLSDALCYARERGARRIVDVATLTGAATTALGEACFALMTNNDELAVAVEAAAAAAGEKSWRLPMWKDYDDYIKSDIADMKNTTSKGAGTIAGAKLLERFVGDAPWVHLDIANVDMASADKGWISKGATGYSVRTLINLATAAGSPG